MRKSKLEIISTQIRKDIPRLMELREGCLVQNNDNKEIDIFLAYTSDEYKNAILKDYETGEIWVYFNDYFWINEKEDYAYSIIGHEIMLNDVLEWLDKKYFYNSYYMNSSGVILETKITYVNDKYITKWNLSSPYLKDQSEELIRFLYSLIK